MILEGNLSVALLKSGTPIAILTILIALDLYRQTNKSLQGASPPTRVKTTINTIIKIMHDNSNIRSYMYVNTVPTVLSRVHS